MIGIFPGKALIWAPTSIAYIILSSLVYSKLNPPFADNPGSTLVSSSPFVKEALL